MNPTPHTRELVLFKTKIKIAATTTQHKNNVTANKLSIANLAVTALNKLEQTIAVAPKSAAALPFSLAATEYIAKAFEVGLINPHPKA